jgi:hypothetical protein
MPFDAIVRVSFNGGDPRRNQAANRALVGHAQDAAGSGPFIRTATAAYSCQNGELGDIGKALGELGQALSEHAEFLDFATVTLVQRP